MINGIPQRGFLGMLLATLMLIPIFPLSLSPPLATEYDSKSLEAPSFASEEIRTDGEIITEDIPAESPTVSLSGENIVDTEDCTLLPSLTVTITNEDAQTYDYTFMWLRYDSEIPGATQSTYSPNYAENGETYRAVVTATRKDNGLYASASSNTVTVIRSSSPLIITKGANRCKYENGIVSIIATGDYAIENRNPLTATNHQIHITAESGKVNLTLNGVNINCSKCESEASPLRITGNADVTLILADCSDNKLTGSAKSAGLQKFNSHTAPLTIQCSHFGEVNHVCGEGCGALTATGGENGAGIGGFADCSNITIAGGIITATGGSYGAGIGGSYGGSGDEGNGTHITVSGGTVTAKGGTYGAGIGGSVFGDGENIIISGGTVTATGGYNSAGIGGGNSGNADYITVSGGKVTAKGGSYGSGIGSGRGDTITDPHASYITVSGGNVTATGGSSGAGVGGGGYSNGRHITVSGGTLIATGGKGGAGIGGGRNCTAEDIVISGGSVKASGTSSGANIGGGIKSDKTVGDSVTPISGSANGSLQLKLFTYSFGTAYAQKSVEGIAGLSSYYGTNDIYTSTDGSVYLWLADSTLPDISANANGEILCSDDNGKMNLPALAVSGDISGCSYLDGILNITESGSYTVSNRVTGTPISDRIVISAPDGTVNLTLNSVDIDVSQSEGFAALDITGNADTKIILADNSSNQLISSSGCPGVQKDNADSASLTIGCMSGADENHLCSPSCGTLNASVAVKAHEITYNAGTDCYEINSLAELIWFASDVNSGNSYLNEAVVLTSDISISDIFVWTPIGTSQATAFAGSFNGQGHTVSEISISEGFDFTGFFGYLSGSVTSLQLESASIVGHDNVGGICGYLSGGSISDCMVSGTVSGSSNIGGICGCIDEGTVRNCLYCSLSGSETEIVGNNSNITNCYYLDISADSLTGICVNSDNTDTLITEQIVSGELAWLLNTNGGASDSVNSGLWSQGEKNPVLANNTNPAIYRIVIHNADDSWNQLTTTSYHEAESSVLLPENPQIAENHQTHLPWVNIIGGGLYNAGGEYVVDSDAEFYLLGDVSGNGNIDSYDLSLLKRFVNEYFTAEDVLNGDVTFIWQVANVSGYDPEFDLENSADDEWTNYVDSLDISHLTNYLNCMDIPSR